jgi:hypothetical protein
MLRKIPAFRFDIVNQNPDASISQSKAPPIAQMGSGHGNMPPDLDNATGAMLGGKNEVTQKHLVLRLPIRTVSEANNFEHWTKKHKRHKAQKQAVALALNPHKSEIKLPCHIKITRVAPRKLDRWDNLPMSVKYILDTCCAIVTGDFRPGRADDDERITVSYEQETNSDYSIVIEFVY